MGQSITLALLSTAAADQAATARTRTIPRQPAIHPIPPHPVRTRHASPPTRPIPSQATPFSNQSPRTEARFLPLFAYPFGLIPAMFDPRPTGGRSLRPQSCHAQFLATTHHAEQAAADQGIRSLKPTHAKSTSADEPRDPQRSSSN
ncbi:unnamed protein product [Diplocarpon coronariae]|nr:hypothetical protein JHW43_007887 [Diplocarpon mali]